MCLSNCSLLFSFGVAIQQESIFQAIVYLIIPFHLGSSCAQLHSSKYCLNSDILIYLHLHFYLKIQKHVYNINKIVLEMEYKSSLRVNFYNKITSLNTTTTVLPLSVSLTETRICTFSAKILYEHPEFFVSDIEVFQTILFRQHTIQQRIWEKCIWKTGRGWGEWQNGEED